MKRDQIELAWGLLWMMENSGRHYEEAYQILRKAIGNDPETKCRAIEAAAKHMSMIDVPKYRECRSGVCDV